MLFSSSDVTAQDAIAAVMEGTYLTDHRDMLDRDHVLSQFMERGFDFDGIHYDVSESNMLPNLWWRPCRESLSPYLPFYRFEFLELPDRRGHTFYVRLDGEVFTSVVDSFYNPEDN